MRSNAVSVFYSGYSVDAIGVKVWPGKKYKYHWADVARIRSEMDPIKRFWTTQILFRVGPPFKMQSGRTRLFWQGMERHCDALAAIVSAAPPEADIDEKSRRLAGWGGSDMARQIQLARKSYSEGKPDRMDVVWHHWARLDLKQARRALAEWRVAEPLNPDCHRTEVEVLMDLGEPPAKILPASQRWLEMAPDDHGAEEQTAILLLATDDSRGVEAAVRVLQRAPGNTPVGASLAGHYFRKRDYPAALETWARIEAQTTDTEARREAHEQQKFIQRWRENPLFRIGQRFKLAGRLALVWLPLLLFIGLKAYSIYERSVLEKEREQWQQEMERQFGEERRQREQRGLEHPDPATGWISGPEDKIREHAENGQAAAQYTLAEHYRTGHRQTKDLKEAVRWYALAAERGDANAQREMGHLHAHGEGVAKDELKALEYYERAATGGSGRAAFEAGNYYYQGQVVTKDIDRAVEFLRISAEKDNVYGQEMLGWCYERGEGVAADPLKALELYRKAASKKSRWARVRLVAFLMQNDFPSRDPKEAMQWAEALGDEAPVELSAWLGAILTYGKQVPRDLPQAFKWIRRSAAERDPQRLSELAAYYWQGIGVNSDRGQAVKLWEEAANKGEASAMVKMIECRAFGRGVERDLGQAAQWLEQFRKSHGDTGTAAELEAQIEGVRTWQRLGQPEGGRDALPRILAQLHPIFPLLDRIDAEKEIVVEVDFVVAESGTVESAKARTMQNERLAQFAEEAVSHWLFQPARKDGRPVKCRLRVPVVFRILSDDPQESSQ